MSQTAAANGEPSFFQMRVAAAGGETLPTATHFSIDLHDRTCPECGSPRSELGLKGSCDIENAVSWPDLLGIANWPLFLVSERVVQSIGRFKVSGFVPRQVTLRLAGAKTKEPPPCYFVLDVRGRVDINREASGLGEVEQCPVCFRNLSKRLAEPVRYVPDPSTWDGSMLLRMRNCPNLQMFCTRAVLELARAERWTNARFEPMDVIGKDALAWAGIQYLGQRWPPSEWYPHRSFTGRTTADWIVGLRDEAHTSYVAAHQALSELGAKAVPHLVAALSEESAVTRKRAARVLAVIHARKVALDPAIKERVAQLLADDPDFLWALSQR